MKRVQVPVMVGLLTIISGCSLPFHDAAKMNPSGFVIDVRDNSVIQDASPHCFVENRNDGAEERRYVLVRRSFGRRTRVFAAEVPNGLDIVKGHRVALSSGVCKNGEIPKILHVI